MNLLFRPVISIEFFIGVFEDLVKQRRRFPSFAIANAVGLAMKLCGGLDDEQ